MKRALRPFVSLVILFALLFTSVRPARASLPTQGEVTAIFIGVAAIGALVGVGIYYAVRKTPSITGCAASGPNGLTLQNEADQQTFALIGDTAAVRSGERVRLAGKKRKKDPTGSRAFLVDRLSKDLGPCKVAPATP